MLDKTTRERYTAILEEELLTATGCTEPIALAYSAARLRRLLGRLPERIKIEVSGNIVKNAKSVVVPGTGGLRGIAAAVAAGAAAGRAELGLQVIASVDQAGREAIQECLKSCRMEIVCMDTPRLLEFRLTGDAGGSRAVVHIAEKHLNVIYEEKDGQVLLDRPPEAGGETESDRSCLNLRDIVEYANTQDLARVAPLLDRQLGCNLAIAREGLRGSWGAGVGRVLLEQAGNDALAQVKAYAAAGSDARMAGCEMPVVIVSGSGNQGITASVPVARYAEIIGADKPALYRALLISNLVTIHQKTGIGRLSAYCGAVSAGCGAGAGVAYLQGGGYEEIAATVNNAVAMLSGTVCDGANSSCAAKIALAVEAGLLGCRMQREGRLFRDGEGLVSGEVEQTIANVGRLARQGMRGTDRTILQIMTGT